MDTLNLYSNFKVDKLWCKDLVCLVDDAPSTSNAIGGNMPRILDPEVANHNVSLLTYAAIMEGGEERARDLLSKFLNTLEERLGANPTHNGSSPEICLHDNNAVVGQIHIQWVGDPVPRRITFPPFRRER